MIIDPMFDLFDSLVGGVLHTQHEALMLIDDRQRIVAFNAAAEQMFGCASAQVLGQALERFIPPSHRQAHAAQVAGFTSARKPQQRRMGQHRHVLALRHDGTEFAVEVTLSSVEFAAADGSTHRYFAALVLDRSEEGQLRSGIERYKQRLRSVFELSPVAIWIADDDRIVFANRAAQQQFGAGQELVGQSLYGVFHADSHAALKQQVSRALAGDADAALVQGRIVRPSDASVREVEIAVAALPDHGGATVQMAVADITQRRREASTLEQSRQALRQLSSNIVEAREEERRRIARELHDDLGQRLTALKMELSDLAHATERADHRERLGGVLTMLDETLSSLRRISSDLRPLMLDDLGLNAAIEWLARDVARRMDIAVTTHLRETETTLDDRIATHLFRMVQEALTNVVRHARARNVGITLAHEADDIVLTVQDDGIGYPQRALQREGSYGLLGMRERAGLLGGHVEIHNTPGACLSVRLPRHTPPVVAREEMRHEYAEPLRG